MPDKMDTFDWIRSYPHCVTVCDTEGIIIAMNTVSQENFRKYGGGELIGSSLFACHPESANVIIRDQLANETANTYITESKDKKRLISQVPWYDGGTFGGMVETIMELPAEMDIKKRT
jgi:transcriptional regulator with PAS, ATPase and Fis domain